MSLPSKQTATGWHPDPEFWSAHRAEHCFVEGYELIAFDLPAANGFPAEIGWELFGAEYATLIATGLAVTFDAAKAAAEAALAEHASRSLSDSGPVVCTPREADEPAGRGALE
ncbi:hypothetical protein [Bradyrhizobium sp. STM 3557]|uniref:hypothetical protein n=1 Tax=Bradyrhizobium sp. STM 3557 TaxID=578920 RepID=UPI00388D4E1F